MSYYDNHLGTSFGGWLTYDSNGNTIGFATNKHSFRDYGLYPRNKPVISTPEIQKINYEVPGRDGLYDATEALTGDVHYYNRTGSWEFTQTGGRGKWDATYHKLKNDLHGQRKMIVIDEERDGYYVGRISVDEPTYDDKRGIAIFKISADLEPYKNAFTLSSEPWLWDPFSFTDGYIGSYTGKTLISKPGDEGVVRWTIRGTKKPIVPHIILEKDPNWNYYSYGGDGTPHIKFRYQYYVDGESVMRTIDLVEGDNIDQIPELVLRYGITYYMVFWGRYNDPNGRGYVKLSYREGWL